MSGSGRKDEPGKFQVMVVDDDASVRGLLVRVMAADGYGAHAAADGAEALAIAAAAPLDLVLLDLGLPGDAGWEVYEKLTAKNPQLAVVIVTATPGQLDVAAAAGVDAFFEKPLDFPALLETVHRLLVEPTETRRSRQSGRRAPRPALKTVRAIGPRKIL